MDVNSQTKVFPVLRICGVAGWICILALTAQAGSWTQFRGPNGSGLADTNAALPSAIGPDENVVWKTPLPSGHSSPVVIGNRIFVTAARRERLSTIALDRQSGKILWERDANHGRLEEIHQIGSHAQSTPAADAERVVSFFGSCGLVCYDHAGVLLWKAPMGPFKNNYGAASSPIIVGDFVILNQDHDIDSFLVAIHKVTGKIAWKSDRGEFPRGFSTPIVWNNAGHEELVVPGALRVCGYDLADGKELWTVRGSARICTMSPVIGQDGTLFVSEWAPGGDEGSRIVAEPFAQIKRQYDKDESNTIERSELPSGPLSQRFDQLDRDKDGHITPVEYTWAENLFNSATNTVLAIRPGGSGDLTSTNVRWRYNKQLPYVPSPVFYKGRLYMVKNGGIASCVDVTTGKQLKQFRLSASHDYYSSPVIGDGKLFLIDKIGVATVLSADPDLKVLSTAEFDELTFATPALVDGRIYLRTAGHLYCFGQPSP